MGYQLLSSLSNTKHPYLLGGVLRFLIRRETLSTLEAWGDEGSSLARRLTRFSIHLTSDFPPIAAPPWDQRIDDALRGQLSMGYVSAVLSTRKAPGLNLSEQAGISELRVWILIKSLEYSAAGSAHDRSLRDLSNHLRHALDGVSSDKLTWFRKIAAPAGARGTFEQSLGHLAAVEPGGEGWQKDAVRSIEALLTDERRPISSTEEDRNEFPLPDGFWDDTPTPSPVRWQDSESIFLSSENPTDDEADQVFQPVTSEALNPAQSASTARGIEILGQHDRQFLAYAWNRPNPNERVELFRTLDEALAGANLELRTLAALASVCLLARRSLRQLASIPIAHEISDDWSLDIQAGRLQRRPSRRIVRWKATDTSTSWIQPLSKVWHLNLPTPVADALRVAHSSLPRAQHLADLWTYSKTPELSFKHWCQARPGLNRLSSGLLPRHTEQILFEESCDAVLARIGTATSNSIIPGAGAYASWSSLSTEASYRRVLPGCQLAAGDTGQNALGSELDPDDKLLNQAFADATCRINELPDGEWADHHNFLVGFVAAVLLAATGARPVRSMFESSHHFDLEGLRVFIEDKASSSGSTGSSTRIVPLPKAAANLLSGIYFPHLARMGRALSPLLPDLGKEIEAQALGAGSTKIPMLFLVTTKGSFDWYEVTEDSLSALGLFKWPLPWNLFRHRLATRLRFLGLDPELIDAQLGHVESGSQTFGDCSPRCWIEDYPAWSHALDASLSMLGVKLPAARTIAVPELQLEPGYQPWAVGLIGSAAREQARRKKHSQARIQAREEINAALIGRPPASLSGQEWTAIGRQMLLRADNLPHSYASIRYEVFERYVDRLWREDGVNVRISHRQIKAPPVRTVFFAEMLSAQSRLQILRTALDKELVETTLSGASKWTSGVLAAMDLAICGRIADASLLSGVLNPTGQQLELVIRGKDGYLHFHAPPGATSRRLPIQRYIAPSRSLQFLAKALSTQRKPTSDAAPDWLIQACAQVGIHATNCEQVLIEIAKLVDFDNSLIFPGLVTGLLAGRIQSYALWPEDWLRASDGKARIAPGSGDLAPTVDTPTEVPSYIGNSTDSSEQRSQSSRALLTNIRKALRVRRSHEESGRPSTNSVTQESPLRRHVRSQVHAALHQARKSVSPAVHSLGAWVLNLLSRPYKGRLLDQASIDRYLSALSIGFLSFGSDLDLTDLDEDEITDFYSQIIDPHMAVSDEDEIYRDPAATASKSIAARAYVLHRLREFHRFAETQYGLAQPDWSELDQASTGRLGNPGLIRFDEYELALKHLSPDPEEDPASAVRKGFVLLLAFRFGLRGGEAISLARSDWVDVARGIVVLVSGRHRKLKTRGSQRQVPLLGELTAREKAVTRRWMEHWQAQSCGDDRVPLFFDDENHYCVVDLAPIRRTIIDTLRHVTGSGQTNLHHARHSFANLVAQLVLVPEGSALWPATGNDALPSQSSTKRLLLGTEKPTRRSPWAVARLLGHSVLQTTFGSYLHCIHDWSESRVRSLNPASFGGARPATFDEHVRIDQWAFISDAHRPQLPLAERLKEVSLTPSTVMEYFSLRARGVSTRVARTECNVTRECTEQIEAFLAVMAQRLGFAGEDEDELGKKLGIGHLLSKIQTPRWQALKDQAAAVIHPEPEQLRLRVELLELLGRNRQILIWDVGHLDIIDAYVKVCHWQWDQLDVYAASSAHPKILGALQSRGITTKRSVDPVSRRKSFQIDGAYIKIPGKLPIKARASAAVVRGNRLEHIRDNYELIALWAAMAIASAIPGRPAPTQ